jgi:nitrate reductase NapE component
MPNRPKFEQGEPLLNFFIIHFAIYPVVAVLIL